MTQTQEQIEHLRTLQETSSFWADVAENQLPTLAEKIDNIDLTPIENKVDEGVSTLSDKIDNIKLPEIDTTNIASKDLERFFGVKPIEGYEFMTPEEVCSELEDIMTSMDLGLTPEMAKEITNNTLNKE